MSGTGVGRDRSPSRAPTGANFQRHTAPNMPGAGVAGNRDLDTGVLGQSPIPFFDLTIDPPQLHEPRMPGGQPRMPGGQPRTLARRADGTPAHQSGPFAPGGAGPDGGPASFERVALLRAISGPEPRQEDLSIFRHLIEYDHDFRRMIIRCEEAFCSQEKYRHALQLSMIVFAACSGLERGQPLPDSFGTMFRQDQILGPRRFAEVEAAVRAMGIKPSNALSIDPARGLDQQRPNPQPPDLEGLIQQIPIRPIPGLPMPRPAIPMQIPPMPRPAIPMQIPPISDPQIPLRQRAEQQTPLRQRAEQQTPLRQRAEQQTPLWQNPDLQTPIPHVPIPHVPIPHVPIPHVPIPHVPIPHVPIPGLPGMPISGPRISSSQLDASVMPVSPIHFPPMFEVLPGHGSARASHSQTPAAQQGPNPVPRSISQSSIIPIGDHYQFPQRQPIISTGRELVHQSRLSVGTHMVTSGDNPRGAQVQRKVEPPRANSGGDLAQTRSGGRQEEDIAQARAHDPRQQQRRAKQDLGRHGEEASRSRSRSRQPSGSQERRTGTPSRTPSAAGPRRRREAGSREGTEEWPWGGGSNGGRDSRGARSREREAGR